MEVAFKSLSYDLLVGSILCLAQLGFSGWQNASMSQGPGGVGWGELRSSECCPVERAAG